MFEHFPVAPPYSLSRGVEARTTPYPFLSLDLSLVDTAPLLLYGRRSGVVVPVQFELWLSWGGPNKGLGKWGPRSSGERKGRS